MVCSRERPRLPLPRCAYSMRPISAGAPAPGRRVGMLQPASEHRAASAPMRAVLPAGCSTHATPAWAAPQGRAARGAVGSRRRLQGAANGQMPWQPVAGSAALAAIREHVWHAPCMLTFPASGLQEPQTGPQQCRRLVLGLASPTAAARGCCMRARNLCKCGAVVWAGSEALRQGAANLAGPPSTRLPNHPRSLPQEGLAVHRPHCAALHPRWASTQQGTAGLALPLKGARPLDVITAFPAQAPPVWAASAGQGRLSAGESRGLVAAGRPWGPWTRCHRANDGSQPTGARGGRPAARARSRG